MEEYKGVANDNQPIEGGPNVGQMLQGWTVTMMKISSIFDSETPAPPGYLVVIWATNVLVFGHVQPKQQNYDMLNL